MQIVYQYDKEDIELLKQAKDLPENPCNACRKSFVLVIYDYKRDRITYINLDFSRSSVALIESEIVKVLSNSVTCSVLLAVVMDGEEYWCI